MEPNMVGTYMLAYFGWMGPRFGDYVAGPLVIVGWDRAADTYHDVPAELVEYAGRFEVFTIEIEK
jgi:hypothetical protein